MAINSYLILVLIGIIVGLFSGAFGIGGGLILIPMLVYGLGFSQQSAQGTSLAVLLFPIGIFAYLNYHRAGYVDFKCAVILAVAFMVGSYFGSKISLIIPVSLMKRAFGMVLLLISLKMVLSK